MIRFVAALLVALMSASCATNETSSRTFFDPLTSVTITYASKPIVFYRDVAGRAAYAKDYVYLGSLEVNRSGDFRYYLWLGIWKTMQDARPGQTLDGFESIVVFADGEPLPLEAAGWTPDAVGASQSVYTKPVATAAESYYMVTADQLRLMAEASDIRIQTGGIEAEVYELWDEQRAARFELYGIIR
ncbi:MAG: hypothetical protein WBN09_13080 [Woeseiaceae bacterium]